MYAALKFPLGVYIICHRCTEKEKREKQRRLLFSVFSVTKWQNLLFNSADVKLLIASYILNQYQSSVTIKGNHIASMQVVDNMVGL